MNRGTRPAAAAALMALLACSGPAARAQEPSFTASDLARKIQLFAEPGVAFRYNQGMGPYGPPTLTLFDRPRAFYPGQKVRLAIRLPRDARLAAPLEVRAAMALHDLDGVKLQDAGEAALRAEGQQVTGVLDWTVPEVREGAYFLAARFRDAEGKPLVTRSQVVFVAPDYPRLLAEAGELRIEAGSLPPLLREVSVPSTQMLLEDAEMRFSDFGRAPRDWEYVRRQLLTAREYALRLAEGFDPFENRTGLLVKAYRSEADDTLQPYALHVPRAYDAGRAWPLVVMLHGASSNHLLARRRVFGLGNRPGESDYEAIRNEDVAFPELDFIVLAPYGRGEAAGYNGLAEQDVLRAMADVSRAYNVDPDRVYLTGLSMGGGGTWHLGLRYPDRFAAIAPVCALSDLTLMPFARDLAGDDRALVELTAPSAIAENARNQQVFVFHGDEDPAVSVEQSRRMVARFRELGWLGSSVHYFEQPGVNHLAWDFAYRDASLFARLAKLRRNPSPDHVTYSTHSPRYHQAYWLRIDRIDRGFRLARIEGMRGAGGFEIRTFNLSAFTLLLDRARVPAGRPLEVRVDGRRAWRGTARAASLGFARDRSGRWREKPWSGPAVGPPDHAEAGFGGATIVERDAHVYVYGTGGDEETNLALRQAAERLADWGPNVRARFAVLADADVMPETMASRNLVLLGGAAVNRVVARVADRLPIREGAFRLVHPNPLAAGRYLHVYGARSAAELAWMLPPVGTFPPVVAPDCVVFGPDGKPAFRGYFKDDWRLGAAAPAR
jgi:hypothetical protein